MGTTYNEGKAVYISGSGLLMSLATGGFSKNSQWWYFAWKNLQWGFCYVGYCCPSFIVVFTFPSYFSMPPALQPGFSGLWRPLSSLSSTLATLDCFCFFIYHKRYGFEWAFFTHSCFYNALLPWYFWHYLLLSRSPWEPAVLPWSFQGFMLILKTET